MSDEKSDGEVTLDPTTINPANNPLGTFALRFQFINNSGSNITGLRLRVDNVSTLCGPQTATLSVGPGDARNMLSSSVGWFDYQGPVHAHYDWIKYSP